MADGWIYGVLTGDIIRSTALKKEYGDELIAFLRETLDEAGKNNIKPYSIFRGDSFQGITRDPEDALKDAIFIRLALISSRYSRDSKEEHLDARIAVGIGTIDYLPEKYSVGEGDGEAFRNSGPELDKLKAENKNLIIKTPWDEMNEEFEIYCAFLDRSLDSITPKQAGALMYYFKGSTQQEIAEKLGKSQSAISNRIKKTDYHIIEKIIAAYKRKIQEELNIKRHFKDKGSEAKWLLDVGNTYFERFKYREAFSQFEKGLLMAREIGDRGKEAQALHQIGMVYQDTNRFEKALEYYNRSLVIKQEIGNRNLEATTLHQIGMTYQLTNRFDEALDYYNQSLEIEKEIGNRNLEATTLHQIGMVYQNTRRFEDALEYYNRSLVIKQEIGNRQGEAGTLHQIGMVYQDTNRFDEALEYYNRSLVIKQEIGNRQGEASTLHQIGTVYQLTRRFDEALDYYNQSLEIEKEIGNRQGEASTLHQIGMVYQDTSRFDEALEYYNRSLVIEQEIGARKGEARTLIATGIAHKALNQPDRAIEIFTDLIERFKTSKNPEILAFVAMAQSQLSGMEKEPSGT